MRLGWHSCFHDMLLICQELERADCYWEVIVLFLHFYLSIKGGDFGSNNTFGCLNRGKLANQKDFDLPNLDPLFQKIRDRHDPSFWTRPLAQNGTRNGVRGLQGRFIGICVAIDFYLYLLIPR